jgi:Fe-S-cluster containining protein
MAGERDDGDPITRGELHEALRFLHAMAMQGKAELDRIDAVLAAIVQALLGAGRLDGRRVEALLPEANARVGERAKLELTVDIGPSVDKYQATGPTDLDCAALAPICKARCCRLTFALSFQDLDEGVVRWEYAAPYRIRKRDDGYCVHSAPDTGRCGVYTQRPATCRTYDCRKDPRIWEDFERRIPSPWQRLDPAPRLYQVRRPPDDGAPRMDAAGSPAPPADGEEPV